VHAIESLGFSRASDAGATRTAIGVTGNQGAVDIGHFREFAGPSRGGSRDQTLQIDLARSTAEPTVVDGRGLSDAHGPAMIRKRPPPIFAPRTSNNRWLGP